MTQGADSGIAVLLEISSAVVRKRNINALLEKVLEILNRRMGMLRGTFALRRGDILSIEASQGLDEEKKRRGRYRLGEGITGMVAATGKATVVQDISRDSRFLDLTGARSKRHTSFLCVPILRNGRILGTLSIDREGGASPDTLANDLKLLEIIASLTGEAVEARRAELEERECLIAENKRLRNALDTAENPGELIGNSGTMRKVYELIRQVAPSNATVLIRGSTGTGKEVVANAIRKLSPRANAPFVAFNCAAMPEGLVESELFGHEKGAFTGAVSRRIGRAEAADGGTLFLDEIGDLSLQVQVKLLRFIQERTFSRLGGNAEIKTNVRLLAATSRDLEKLMAEGKFREDLYYRLNIFQINLPDLKHRRSDILLLAEHFISRLNVKYNKKIRRLSTPAINMLMAYHWPGNVRELENCMEHAVLTTTDDTIHAFNLPATLQMKDGDGRDGTQEDTPVSFNTMVQSFERELIVDSLKRNNGNMSAAARALGLSPRVIHYKIHNYGITPEWYKKDADS